MSTFGNYKPITATQRNNQRAKRTETITKHWIRKYGVQGLEMGILDFIIAYHGVNLVSALSCHRTLHSVRSTRTVHNHHETTNTTFKNQNSFVGITSPQRKCRWGELLTTKRKQIVHPHISLN